MKIRTRMQLGTIVSIALVVAFGVIVAVLIRNFSFSVDQERAIDGIVAEVFELNALTTEYINDRSNSSRYRWESKNRRIAEVISSRRIRAAGEAEIVERLAKNNAAIAGAFHVLKEISDDELAEKLVDDLIFRSQAIVSNALELKGLIRSSLEKTEKRVVIMLSVSMALLVLISITSAVSLNNTVAIPVAALTDVATRISKSEPDVRIDELDFDPKNEIGELAAAFSTMLINLDRTTVSRDALLKEVAERKRMEQELIKVEKLESIGVLAGGIAHDLNNYLTGIVGYISLARSTSDPSKVDETLKAAEHEALRVKDLTKRLLTFAKGGSPVPVIADLGEVVRDAVDFTLSGSNVSCDCAQSPDETFPALIDIGQMRQVINNLVLNARQAMPEGGQIQVRVEKIELGNGNEAALAAGPYIKMWIEDHGPGVPEEDRQRIFDPFFSTKSTGSGLGLATSYSIIRKHYGHISVASGLDGGARFEIFLPASAGDLLEQREDDDSGILTGEGRILVMDDEEPIRDIVDASLSRSGYEVVTCKDGAAALKMYESAMVSGNPFNAVILDLTIPGGLGGAEVVKKLKDMDPDVRAIVASGYSDNSVMSNASDFGFKAGIAKPYELNSLRKLVRSVVQES